MMPLLINHSRHQWLRLQGYQSYLLQFLQNKVQQYWFGYKIILFMYFYMNILFLFTVSLCQAKLLLYNNGILKTNTNTDFRLLRFILFVLILIIQMIDESNEAKEDPNASKQYKKIQSYVFSYQWKLGSGSFSDVYKGVDTNNNNSAVAIKVVKMQSITSKVAMSLLQQQIAILKQLDNENVIKCYDVLNSSNNCYIVTEFCQYGDLQKLLKIKKKFSQQQISPYVYHIYNGLNYLASLGIIHRDFKVANVFVGQYGVCKIADFGFAKKQKSTFTDICLGSPIYMTPQAIRQKKYSPKTDVWAFGVLIYELICGRAPLAGVKTQQQLVNSIILPPPYIKQPISNQLRSFIDRCLTYKQQNRISMQQMQNHQYIRKVIIQNQGMKLSISSSLSDTNTQHTSKSSKLILKALQNPITYQQAVALLQYCRLLSKVCGCIKSQILQQWLLKIIYQVHKTKLKENQQIDMNQYKQTVSNYYNRYNKQFKDKGLKVRIDDVIKECQKLLGKQKKYKPQVIAIGTETTILKQSLSHPLKLLQFAKSSNASRYMSAS